MDEKKSATEQNKTKKEKKKRGKNNTHVHIGILVSPSAQFPLAPKFSPHFGELYSLIVPAI